jgi:hypothetical protein
VCQKYAVFCGAHSEDRMSESKTVGFWEVCERNRWEEKATTAFSGQELTSVVS